MASDIEDLQAKVVLLTEENNRLKTQLDAVNSQPRLLAVQAENRRLQLQVESLTERPVPIDRFPAEIQDMVTIETLRLPGTLQKHDLRLFVTGSPERDKVTMALSDRQRAAYFGQFLQANMHCDKVLHESHDLLTSFSESNNPTLDWTKKIRELKMEFCDFDNDPDDYDYIGFFRSRVERLSDYAQIERFKVHYTIKYSSVRASYVRPGHPGAGFPDLLTVIGNWGKLRVVEVLVSIAPVYCSTLVEQEEWKALGKEGKVYLDRGIANALGNRQHVAKVNVEIRL